MNLAPVVLPALQFAWGVFVKYHPKLASVPNALIPWTNAAAAFVVAIAAPAPAKAAVEAFVPHAPLLASAPAWLASIGHLGALALAAGAQSACVSIAYEFFGRAPLDATLVKSR